MFNWIKSWFANKETIEDINSSNDGIVIGTTIINDTIQEQPPKEQTEEFLSKFPKRLPFVNHHKCKECDNMIRQVLTYPIKLGYLCDDCITNKRLRMQQGYKIKAN